MSFSRVSRPCERLQMRARKCQNFMPGMNTSSFPPFQALGEVKNAGKKTAENSPNSRRLALPNRCVNHGARNSRQLTPDLYKRPEPWSCSKTST